MIVIILISLITICGWFVISKNRGNKRFWELYNQFNGDDQLPIIGHIHKFGSQSDVILKRLFEMYERNGKTTFRMQMVNIPFVLICEPEQIEVLLRSNKEITKLDDYKFLSWLGDGLLLSTGKKWQRQRKIITPTFHFKILEQFISVFNKCGDIFIDNLSKNMNTVVDIYPFVTLCSLDIICQTAMGTNVNAQKNSGSEYVQAIYKTTKLAHHRSFSLFKRFDFIYRLMPEYYTKIKFDKVLHDMSNGVIKTRKIQLKDEIAKKMNQTETVPEGENQFEIKGKTAFLDLLLLSKTADGKPLSDDTIREEVDTFMFEGHDTTSSCIAFAMYCLANNPEVQQLAFDEQFSIFGDDLTREATMNDLNNMNYLEKVIKETLRMYPSVPWYGRHLSDELPLPDGKIIPAGVMAVVIPVLFGQNPKFYPNPTKFDPDRFLQENTVHRNPYLYAPFSAGPRNCIGQKFAMLDIKLILSKVIRSYELSGAGDEYNVILIAEIILKSKNGMHLKIKKREYGVVTNGVKSNGVTSNNTSNGKTTNGFAH